MHILRTNNIQRKIENKIEKDCNTCTDFSDYNSKHHKVFKIKLTKITY